MKKSTFLLGAAMAALTVGSAAAADLAVKARAPAPIVAPAFSWTGCYIGLHAGGGAMRSDYVENNAYTDNATAWGNGGLAGGQIGCNYQTGVFVMGIEGEGYWSGMKARNQFNDPLYSEGYGYTQTVEAKNKYDFTVAGRFGVAYDRAFIYGKAGWAWGKFDFSYNATYTNDPNYYLESGSATLNGPLLGVGVEYALTPNWTVKGEYNYINFGLSPVDFRYCYYNCSSSFGGYSNSQSAEKHIFKFGVNYLFNAGGAPLVARY